MRPRSIIRGAGVTSTVAAAAAAICLAVWPSDAAAESACPQVAAQLSAVLHVHLHYLDAGSANECDYTSSDKSTPSTVTVGWTVDTSGMAALRRDENNYRFSGGNVRPASRLGKNAFFGYGLPLGVISPPMWDGGYVWVRGGVCFGIGVMVGAKRLHDEKTLFREATAVLEHVDWP